MNNPFAMDQAEKVGLGAALGGHVFLAALLLAGLFQASRPMGSDGGGSGDGIAVEIVSEGAAVPEPAAPIEAVEPVPEPEILPETVVDPLPQAKPVQKVLEKPQPAKKTTVKTPVKTPVKQTKAGTGKGGGNADFMREMEKKLGNAGGGTGTQTKKGPGEGAGEGKSVKTAGQITREVNAVLGPKILRFIRQCAPSGVDVNRIITSVTLNLAPNGSISSLTGVSQRGITDSNRPQAQPMERCVTGAIRKAAPFTELDPKDYDGWKVHRMSFQPN